MAWLRVLSGRGEGSTFNIGERTFTLGRSPGNLVQLLGKDVSRRHCQFRWDGFKHVVQDLNSENGVLVNGERVTEKTLADGDQVSIGKTVLQFRSGDQMPGAIDHAQRWKEVRAELTGASTATLDQKELSGMLGALRQQLSLDATPVPVPASPSPITGTFSELAAQAFLDHLRAPREVPTLATYLGEATTGAGRLLGACRVSVLLRRVDATGAARLSPVLTWARPDLAPEPRSSPVFAEVVRRAVVENAAVGAQGTGHGAPTTAMAAPLGTAGNWYGVLYADSFAAAPGPFRKAHLDFLASLAGRTAEFLLSTKG